MKLLRKNDKDLYILRWDKHQDTVNFKKARINVCMNIYINVYMNLYSYIHFNPSNGRWQIMKNKILKFKMH